MKKLFAVIILFALCLAPATADELASVENLTRDTVGAVLESLRDTSIDYDKRYSRFTQIVDPVFDFAQMGKLALGRRFWHGLSSAQKKEYTKLFGDLLRKTYFDKMAMFSEVAVEYDTPTRVKKHIYVPMFALSKSERQEVLYKLYSRNGEWKVWDVEVQNVSIVKSYRAQYRQFLSSGTVEDLLKKMRASIGK